MLTVDASSNPYQIWTASLMRWARKAPSPSDEGQAQRLATRMDIFFLHLFASVQKRLDEVIGPDNLPKRKVLGAYRLWVLKGGPK
jgi:hypothetical protein